MISDDQFEKMRAAIEKLIGVSVSSKKIKSIGVNPRARHIPKMTIEVSHTYNELEPKAPAEKVLAIYEATLFCVCTETRNGINAPPYFFLREDVFNVEYDE
jgi:hypothetical protein